MDRKFGVHVARDHPRRVVLSTRGGSTYELAPLEAAHLAALLFGASVDLLEDRELGVPPKGGAAPVVVWESFGAGEGGTWNPAMLSDVRAVQREVRRLQDDGAPYMVTVLLFNDPLYVPAREKAGHDRSD